MTNGEFRLMRSADRCLIEVPLPYDFGTNVAIFLSKTDDSRFVLLLGNTYGPICVTVKASSILLTVEATALVRVDSITVCTKRIKDTAPGSEQH